MALWGNNGGNGGSAAPGIGSESSELMWILQQGDIVPGSDPSYQVCKSLYAYHPLGMKMVDAPIRLAQSLPRQITIPDAPADDLIEAFNAEWDRIGKVGGNRIINNVMRISRIYGIGSLVVGTRGHDPAEPLDLWTLADQDLYFNVLDPLNTAGSLVLDQDPNSADFLKPRGVRVGPQTYSPTRAIVVMNEEPVYIQWTSASFGFVGRSVYQRALFPLKSYIQTMITDDVVTKKAALLVAKLQSPSSIIDNLTKGFFGHKRSQIQGGETGNVLSIGVDESIESIDLKNLRDAAEFARNNIMKNIATAANMPASMINQETLAEGFGEGSEDAKQIARYIDGVRVDMRGLYDFMDEIVMHRAWSRRFYEGLQRKYPDEYAGVPYETKFTDWKNSFKAEWPNLLVEPDSEAVERDSKIMESAIGVAEVLMPILDPDNKATVAAWLGDTMNARKMLVSEPLDIDIDALRDYVPPTPAPKEPETKAAYDI